MQQCLAQDWFSFTDCADSTLACALHLHAGLGRSSHAAQHPASQTKQQLAQLTCQRSQQPVAQADAANAS